MRERTKQIVRAPSAARRRRAARPPRRAPSGAARAPRRVTGGFQIAIRRPAAGEPSSSISVIVLEAGQALGQLDRVGDRRRGQQEARLGSVGGGDPAQSPQHVGDVRAKHAAIDVGLVDDDDGQVREQLAPGGVVGEDPDVEHVGVGEDQVGAPSDLRARLARRVAVVDRGAHRSCEPERADRARLVLGERLRRVEIERARLGDRAARDVERRQVEAQRLAGGRAGGHDRRAVHGCEQRLELVVVKAFDTAASQRLDQARMEPIGKLAPARGAAMLERLTDEQLPAAGSVDAARSMARSRAPSRLPGRPPLAIVRARALPVSKRVAASALLPPFAIRPGAAAFAQRSSIGLPARPQLRRDGRRDRREARPAARRMG